MSITIKQYPEPSALSKLMTSITNMPGRWPDDVSSDSDDDGVDVPTFDNAQAYRPTFLRFPMLDTVVKRGNSTKMRFEPPKELLTCQAGSSKEVKELLSISIERVRARYEEAERNFEKEERLRESPHKSTDSKGSNSAIKESLRLKHQDSQSTNSNQTRLDTLDDKDMLDSNDSGRDHIKANFSSSSEEGSSDRKAKASKYAVVGMLLDRVRGVPAIASMNGKVVSQSDASSSLTVYAKDLFLVEIMLTHNRECVSCLEDVETGETVKLTCHSYCKDCFQRLINNAMEAEDQWPAKCCLNTIPSETITAHLSSTMKRKYKQRAEELSIPAGERVYCARTNCNTWIAPRHIKIHINTARCPKCYHKLCLTCRGPPHATTDCPQDPSIQATIDLAELEGWRRCYSCRVLVEHNSGCRHMTCRCKAQFCYICGAKWKTCSCSDTDLANIHINARQRRAAQLTPTSDTIEEEEMREAIRMVEEYEAAENQRLAREAEAEFRRNEKIRKNQQKKKLADLANFLHDLDMELELLHDLQRAALLNRHESEAKSLQTEKNQELGRLSTIQVQRLNDATEQSERTISTMEDSLAREYETRAKAERHTEKDYTQALTSYWHGNPNMEDIIRESVEELRIEQDKDYQAWYALRLDQLEKYIAHEEERIQTLKAEQMEDVQSVCTKIDGQCSELKSRQEAEELWVAEIVEERVQMFQAMASEEYTRVLA